MSECFVYTLSNDFTCQLTSQDFNTSDSFEDEIATCE